MELIACTIDSWVLWLGSWSVHLKRLGSCTGGMNALKPGASCLPKSRLFVSFMVVLTCMLGLSSAAVLWVADAVHHGEERRMMDRANFLVTARRHSVSRFL